MKIIGISLNTLALTVLIMVIMHKLAHLPLAPSAAWLDWFKSLPLPTDHHDIRTAVVPILCVLLFLAGFRLTKATKSAGNQMEDES